MSGWIPECEWEGQDAYVIGGGPSLHNFDWNLLRGKNTIGCNDAYKLGEEICKVCIFGDTNFWRVYHEGLATFKNPVVTSNQSFLSKDLPWLKVMDRKARGMSRTGLGWNTNTGASGLNLALLYGAKRVFLLGFDMTMRDGKTNWHDEIVTKPNPKVYDKFLRAFEYVARDASLLFPDREIFNLTDSSRLDVFPKVSLAVHFRKETELCEPCVQS